MDGPNAGAYLETRALLLGDSDRVPIGFPHMVRCNLMCWDSGKSSTLFSISDWVVECIAASMKAAAEIKARIAAGFTDTNELHANDKSNRTNIYLI